MGTEIKEIDEMVATECESHHMEHKLDTKDSSISAAEGTDDGMVDVSNCKENKESNVELRNGVFAENIANLDSMEKTVMGNSSDQGMGEVQDLKSLTDRVTLNEKKEIINEDTNTTKEVLLVPEKRVLKGKTVVKKIVKKVVKKRRLVKGNVAAKEEEEPQSSEIFEPSVGVHTNQNVKSEEDVQQHNGAALASDEGVNEMFRVSKEDIRVETVMGDSSNQDTSEAKDLESPTDAVTLNSKEKIVNVETDTKNEVLLVSEKKVLNPKKVVRKVVKKRKLVKGKVSAKDVEEAQFSEMHEPSVEVQTNQNLKNEENPDAKSVDNINSSTAGRAKKKNPHQITDEVEVKLNQREKNKKVVKEKTASKRENMDKAEPSEIHKSSDEQETVGMIFMCSSKTKEDCYRYNVFGLPATKKESVLKIYDGMKLFLYDFRQKLLYGIYKAAGPGGYLIEPKAFHSNYPSQVRFSIDDDCNPLPEAKFRKVIEENYFTNTKFKAELNSIQVKSLCELFLVNKKGMSEVKTVAQTPKVGIHPTIEREKKKGTMSEVKTVTESPKARVHPTLEQEKKKVTMSEVKTVTESPKLGVRPTLEGEKKKGTMSEVKTVTESPKAGNLPTVEQEKKEVTMPEIKTVTESPKLGARPTVEGEKKRKARVDNEVNQDSKKRRVVDDVKHAKGKEKVIHPRVNGDMSRPMAKGGVRVQNDARRLKLEDNARRSRAEDARRARAKADARRFRANEEARRSRANEDARRSRANEDARRLWREDEERRLRREDEERRVRRGDASRLQLEDDARRLRGENDSRRVRAEDDARFLRDQEDARRLRVEEDARRLLVEDRIRSPYTLSSRYSRLAEAYERETYVPSALSAPLHLDVAPPPIIPTYTSPYAYGRTSVLDGYRSNGIIGHEDRGLASSGLRPLYEQQRLDPYSAYREPTDIRNPALGTRQIYAPTDPQDEYLPSTSRMSTSYGVPPYRRY